MMTDPTPEALRTAVERVVAQMRESAVKRVRTIAEQRIDDKWADMLERALASPPVAGVKVVKCPYCDGELTGSYLNLSCDCGARVQLLRPPVAGETPPAMLSLHRCKVCGTRWLFWANEGLYNLLDQHQRPGACCDNAQMGEQIEHVRDLIPHAGQPPPPPTSPSPGNEPLTNALARVPMHGRLVKPAGPYVLIQDLAPWLLTSAGFVADEPPRSPARDA